MFSMFHPPHDAFCSSAVTVHFTHWTIFTPISINATKDKAFHLWRPPDIAAAGDHIWKERERSFINVLRQEHTTPRNICLGVRSPIEGVFWTLIWDYSRKKLHQEQAGITVSFRRFCLTATWYDHTSVPSSFSPTVLQLCMCCWFAVVGFQKVTERANVTGHINDWKMTEI